MKKLSLFILTTLLLILAACSPKSNPYPIPKWIVDELNLIETENDNIFHSKSRENIVFRYYEVEGMSVIRSFGVVEFENIVNAPENFPDPTISVEEAVQIFIQDINLNRKESIMEYIDAGEFFVDMALDRAGWLLIVRVPNDATYTAFRSSYIIDSNTGDIITTNLLGLGE